MIREKINITLTPDVIEYLDKKSAFFGLSRSAFVNQIISDYMKTEINLKEKVPDLLKDVENIKKSLEKYGISVPDMNASAVLDTGVSEPASDKTIK